MPGLLADPFRPFFLGATLFALFAVPVWIWVFVSAPPEMSGFDAYAWHIHEMLFGYLGAVLTGFLFTAIPNWTGRLPLRGPVLGLLALLWLAGRLAVAAWPGHPGAAVVDIAFLLVIACFAWREILAGRNWRNAPICLLVSLLAVANLLFWLPAAGDVGWRLGLGVAALLIALVGGRIVPSFTRNWLAKRDASSLPVPFGTYDKLCLLALAVAFVAWIIEPFANWTGALMMAASALHFVRLLRWRPWLTVVEPLLLVLHLGYGWLILAMLLMGCAILGFGGIQPTAALHALSVGAVGTMTLGVMARATLGHSGRALTADRGTTVIIGAITLSALLRVAAPNLPMAYDTVIVASGLAWCVAFGLFVAVYGPILSDLENGD